MLNVGKCFLVVEAVDGVYIYIGLYFLSLLFREIRANGEILKLNRTELYNDY